MPIPRGVVAVNLAHHERCPRSARAAVRVLGRFADVEEARAHFAGAHVDAEVHCVPEGDFFVVMRRAGEDEAGHLEALKRTHRRRIREHAEEFEANVLQRQTGRVGAQPEDDEPAPPEGEVAPALPVPRALEVRLQAYAVVSILDDHDEPELARRQPGFCVHGAFESHERAMEVVRGSLSKHVLDHDLFVASMYEWLYVPRPRDLDELEEEYRSKDLHELMAHRKAAGARVAEYRRQCALREERPREILLPGPGEERPPQPPLELFTAVAHEEYREDDARPAAE